jgi:hypothetical protein
LGLIATENILSNVQLLNVDESVVKTHWHVKFIERTN